MRYQRAAISFLITVAGFSLRAQQPDMPPVSQERLADYQLAHPSSNLYLHLDKTVYTPEETVWFKAYLLGDTAPEAKVLYVRIVDEEKISPCQDYPHTQPAGMGGIEARRNRIPANVP